MNGGADMPRVGREIDGRFKLAAFLGAGNFGAVYRARQRVFDLELRDVALKVFKGAVVDHSNAPVKLNDAIQLMRLAEEDPEPEVAAHLIRVLDVFIAREAPHWPVLVMELVPDSATLSNPIRQYAPMPVALSLYYLRQILLPLRWMHTRGVPRVHNDLKPENLLLTRRGLVKLGDFGLAAMLPGMALGGTIPYQSPETLQGELADTASDVYSVGVLWFEMLTGHGPFADVGLEAQAAGDDDAFTAAHQMARREPIPNAAQFNEDLQAHPDIERILFRALARSSEKRYHSAAHLWADLEPYFLKGSTAVLVPLEEQASEVPAVRLATNTPAQAQAQAQRLIAEGKPDEAILILDRLVKTDGENPENWRLLARVAAQTGQVEKAYDAAACSEKLRKNAPETFEVWADVYVADQRPDLAQEARKKAAELRRKGIRR